MRSKINQANVKSFFDNTSEYLENNVVIGIRKSIIQNLAGSVSGLSIIDIGCGDGEISLQYIDNNDVTFVDLSKKMLEKVAQKIPADKRTNVRYINSTVESLQIAEKFDIVIGFGLLAHVPDISFTINKLTQLLSGDGKLYIQFTDCSKSISKFIYIKGKITGMFRKRNSYSTNHTTLREIKKYLEDNSLNILDNVYYYPVLPFMKFVSFEKRKKILERLSSNHFTKGFGSEIVLALSHKKRDENV